MLQFVLGRAGSGKTAYMRRSLLERSAQSGAECVMLVPEQYSFETEKAMLRLAGPIRGNAIKVYSFTRLAEAVFRQAGGAQGRRLSDGGRRILMASAVSACEDRLEVYASAARSGRLTDLMLTAVNELKMCGISPADLLDTAGELESRSLIKKLQEVSMIYASYDALVAASYLDSRDDLTRLRQALEGSDAFRGAEIFVDSFEGFTAQEMGVLGQLMRQAKTVTVSLCTDGLGGDETGLFALVDRTRQRLTRLAEDLAVKILPPMTLDRPMRFQNEDMKLLEAQLFTSGERLTADSCDAITLYSARDVFQESELIAATIQQLALSGLRYRDISIICRDPDRYYGSLDVALMKRDIPCFMSQPIRVDAEPVSRFVLGAFQVVQAGFDTDLLLELLKTGVSGFEAGEISELENYAFLWRMNGKSWRQELTRHPRGFVREITQEDEELLARLNALRLRLIPPLEQFQSATRDASGAQIAQAVYDLLMAFGLDETLPEFCRRLEQAGDAAAAQRQLRVWDLLMETLDQMHSILGGRKTSRERFYRLLKEVVSAEDVSDIPQRVDEVIFGTAELVRQSSPRVVFLIGVTQGDFPRSPKSSGVFSDVERRELIERQLPLGDPLEQKAIEERYLCYSVACAASERLYISWPSSVGGEEKEPSELVTEALSIFPALQPLEDLPEEWLSAGREAAFSRMASVWRENSPRSAALRMYIEDEPLYAARLAALERAGGRRPQRIEDRELTRAVYGRQLFVSPTQIETYHSCPFKYYCRYGLGARERKPAQVDVLQYGTIMHYLFERVFSEPPEARAGRSEEELYALVKELIQSFAQENMGGADLLSGREKYRLERLAQSACKLIAHVERELAQSRFVPEHMEWQLGRGAPALRVETGTGATITVGGTIDRVDVLREADGRSFVRVIDYKTGNKTFKLADVLDGMNMQMLVYLAAITQHGSLEESWEPAGILYMPAAEPDVSADRSAGEDEIMAAAESKLKMSGLILSDSEIIEAMEAGAKGKFIPAKLNKDGSPSKQSSVLDRESLRKVLDFSTRLIASMGRELEAGAAAVRPNMRNQSACRFCPYSAICGSELGDRDVENERMDAAQAMTEIERRLEAEL